jgi:hypothetical protein
MAAAVVAAGCGSSATTIGGSVSSVAVDRGPGDVEVVGGSEAQQELLRQLLAGMEEPGLERVELREAAGEPALEGVPGGTVVRSLWAKGSGGVGAWHAHLLNAAFADRSAELGLPCVTWGETRGGGSLLGCPAGAARPRCSGFAGGGPGALADAHGAELTLHERLALGPGREAHQVEVQVADAPTFMRDEMEEFVREIRDAVGGCMGSYVVVADGGETPAYRGWSVHGNSTRMGTTGGIREDLRGCWSEPDFGEPPSPPPCPA